ncbi:hypothetical protein AMK34_10450 [Amycolatopsis sp. CB00013]|nr:hypothetical protein AMK34_10450 [Amycolatopsis sp. CB00013]
MVVSDNVVWRRSSQLLEESRESRALFRFAVVAPVDIFSGNNEAELLCSTFAGCSLELNGSFGQLGIPFIDA